MIEILQCSIGHLNSRKEWALMIQLFQSAFVIYFVDREGARILGLDAKDISRSLRAFKVPFGEGT